ncbi:MAG: hypothetical protein ACLGGX_02610 [Bdellovibrionia bacterium]
MEKFISKISGLKNKIDSLLNEDFEHNPDLKKHIQQHFQLQTNPNLIRDISVGLPDSHVDRAVVLFQRLADFAEYGYFFENQDGTHKLYATFQFGVVSPIHSEPRPAMSLPHADLLTVLQTNATNIVEKIPQVKIQNSEDYRAFLIRISSDFTIILLSKLPDPWMKVHMEDLHRAITLSMGEAI